VKKNRQSRLNILLLCYEFPPLGGGGSHVVHGLGREYVKMGHEVQVVTMSFKGLPKKEKVDGMVVHRVKGIRFKQSKCTFLEMIPYLFFAKRKVKQLHQNKALDVVHAHFIFPDGLLFSRIYKKIGVPFIITAHGSDVPGYNPGRFRLLHRLLLPIWKSVIRKTNAVICPSRTLKELIHKNIPLQEKLHVIPNGISLHKFRADRKKENVILLVSRLFKRKGVQYFLDAFKDIESGYTAHIVGDGPYLEILKKQALSIKQKVIFHGHLDNNSRTFKDLYETSRIFVFTSTMENFPIVLLEAMLAGAAIVTSDSTGCAESVGKTALLVPAENPEKIRAAIMTYILNPDKAASFGQKAKSRVDNNFSWEKVAMENIKILYAAIMEG